MNTEEYAIRLKSFLDFQSYEMLVTSIGESLNNHKDRFDKADLIEQGIEEYSRGRLKWIDEEGRDHYDIVSKIFLEFKYQNYCLYNEKNVPKKTVSIKLKNNQGKGMGSEIQRPADFYVIAQHNAISVISYQDLKPFLVAVDDGIVIKAPFEAFHPVYFNDTIISGIKIDYKKEKQRLQKRVVKKIKNKRRFSNWSERLKNVIKKTS
jgi:hypothetical protein